MSGNGDPFSLNIVQWNSGGASALRLLSGRDADVIVLQETRSIRRPEDITRFIPKHICSDFTPYITPPHSSSSQGLLTLVKCSLRSSLLLNYSCPALSCLVVSLCKNGKRFSLANVYIRPGEIHKNRDILDNILDSGYDMILGDFNDRTGRWINAAHRRARNRYFIHKPPSPTFHCSTTNSLLDLLLIHERWLLKPFCTEQSRQHLTTSHDLIRWRIEEDTLLRRRFCFDPIRVAVFQAAISRFPRIGNESLTEFNTYLSSQATGILSITYKGRIYCPTPTKLKTLAHLLHSPNLSASARQVLSKEYWSTRYRFQLGKDRASIASLNPARSSFWKIFKKEKSVSWKERASGWIGSIGLDKVLEESLALHNYGATQSPQPIPPWGDFRSRDVSVPEILNAWGPLPGTSKTIAPLSSRVCQLLTADQRREVAVTMLLASPSDVAGINISKRIFIHKRNPVRSPKDLRPISIQNSLVSIYEKALARRIRDHLTRHHLIPPGFHGSSVGRTVIN
ncbi:hypothetical protein GJ496_002456 [Pomphorhynchus laevis]|nr:hypothetical protein GJ496_002456 [Pomphorhynchus laevis]